MVTISVPLVNGTWRQVQAHSVGSFWVHRCPRMVETKHEWVITHKATHHRVGPVFETLNEARSMARKLEPILDWPKVQANLAGLTDEQKKAVREVLS